MRWGRGDPLRGEAAARVLDGLIPATLPAELRELLISRAEGNPFFLEELVGELIDAGVLEKRDGEWVLGPQQVAFAIHATVHAVPAARIDRLPATEKAA